MPYIILVSQNVVRYQRLIKYGFAFSDTIFIQILELFLHDVIQQIRSLNTLIAYVASTN